ncbi:sensor histidine kinase [Dyadobacter sp. 32]|uniref:sensor histidine kinase n=1 Tax=Dyadobacter sp. 32 TaxID=538966 RepID=UPI0011EDCD42
MKFRSRASQAPILTLIISFLSHLSVGQPLIIDQKNLSLARSLELQAIKDKDSVLLAKAFYAYANTYAKAGNNIQAKRFYIKSMHILESEPPSFELGNIYLSICDNLSLKPNSREDFNYIEKAIKVFKQINSPQGLALAYGMLGGAYHWRWTEPDLLKNHKPRFDSILYYYQTQLKIAENIPDSAIILKAYSRIGSLYTSIGDLRHFLEPYQKSIFIAKKIKDDINLIHVSIDLANALVSANKINRAFQILEEAKKTYQKKGIQDFNLQRHLILGYLHHYRITKNWREAHEQLFVLRHLENESETIDNDKTLGAITQELESEKAILKLDLQKRELDLNNRLVRLQKYFIAVTVILLAITTTLTLLFYRLYRQNQRTSIRNEHLVREQNHRVKNNLQMVSSLLNMQARLLSDAGARQAVEESRLRVQAMALIQRKLYDSLDPVAINLAEFIPELADGALYSCGYAHIVHHYNIEPIKLDLEKAIPIGLILTELIINACKYAFPDHEKPTLAITCTALDGEITLQVSDNGPGIKEYAWIKQLSDKNEEIQNRPFGMQLIELQVQQIYGIYKFSTAGGTTFTMEFSK